MKRLLTYGLVAVVFGVAEAIVGITVTRPSSASASGSVQLGGWITYLVPIDGGLSPADSVSKRRDHLPHGTGPAVSDADGHLLVAGKLDPAHVSYIPPAFLAPTFQCGIAWTAQAPTKSVYSVSYNGKTVAVNRSDAGTDLYFET